MGILLNPAAVLKYTMHAGKNSYIVTLSANALKNVSSIQNPGVSFEMRIAIITARLIAKKHMHLFKPRLIISSKHN